MSVKLYVGNLSYEVTESELNELFAPFGQVERVKVVTDRQTGASRGFGFVEFSNRAEAERAIMEMNGKSVRNRTIQVDEARPERPRKGPSRNPSGRLGRGRY